MITDAAVITEAAVPRPAAATRWLLAAAVVVGAVYAFSPLSVIFGGAMFLVFRRTVRGLVGAERRWALGVLVTGLLLRVLALVGMYVTTDPWVRPFHTLFGDGLYSIQRSLWILTEFETGTIGPLYRQAIFAFYGGPAYDRCLAALQHLLGPAPFGLTLISVAAFFGGTMLMYRLVRPSFGPAAALLGLMGLVFWPTFFVWSVSMLKESVQFFLSAVAVAAAVWVARRPQWRVRVVLMAVVAAATALIAPLRVLSWLIVLGGVAFGYAVFASTRRSAVFVAVLLSVAVAGAVVVSRPGVHARAQVFVNMALQNHVGHVLTSGKAYTAADQQFYSDRLVGFRASRIYEDSRVVLMAALGDERPADRFYPGRLSPMRPPTFDEGARFLLRSAAMFFLVPLPSHIVSFSERAFLPQLMAWYVALILAVAGVWIGFRRDVLLTGIFLGYCLAAVAIIAPNSGNIGTLIRHRDIILPFVVWLSGLGAAGLLEAVNRRRDAAP